MISLIARGIYDCIYYCCIGRPQPPQRKSTREILDDLEELAEEEVGIILTYYSQKQKLCCC